MKTKKTQKETIGDSKFLEIFGKTPINKVLDFLIIHTELIDYSISELAEGSKVGYSTLKILIKDLLKKEIVMERVSGRNKMYRLNKNNPLVESFAQFYWDIIRL